MATGTVNPTATAPATELGNVAVTGTGAAATPDSGAVPASAAATAPAAERRTAPVHLDVHAELHEDEEPEETALGPGVMQFHLKVLQDRLKKVVSSSIEPTLISLLKYNLVAAFVERATESSSDGPHVF